MGFSCLQELVRHEFNGMVFDSSGTLAAQLSDLLRGFPKGAHLSRLRDNVLASQVRGRAAVWVQ